MFLINYIHPPLAALSTKVDMRCFQKMNEVGDQLFHSIKSKRLDRVEAMWQILDIARTQDYNANRVLLGLAGARHFSTSEARHPLSSLKSKIHISDYVPPIANCIPYIETFIQDKKKK